MRKAPFAIAIVLLFVAPAVLAFAQTPDELSRETEALSPVRVVDIAGYPADEDGDELLDAIQVLVRVNFTRSGSYILDYKLYPEDKSWWLSHTETLDTDQAVPDERPPYERYMEASFEGWKINKKGYTGNLVARVQVLDDKATKTYSSREEVLGWYSADQFEPPAAGAQVTGFGIAEPMDFDQNGKNEVAEIPVLITSNTAGLFRVVMVYTWTPNVATAVGSDASRSATVTNWTQLEPGENVVPMWVSGGHIMQARNITVTAYVYKGVFPGLPFTAVFQVMSARDYEWPTLRGIFEGTHSEQGVPAGEPPYSYLQVSARLDIDVPGEYSLVAVLSPPGVIPDDSEVTDTKYYERVLDARQAARASHKWTYEPGPGVANFYFDGRLVNAWDENGPLEVRVFVWGPSPFLATSFKFDTAAIDSDDFVAPQPPLVFGAAHDDEGVSKEGNALFDGLRVSFDAVVNTPGTYTAFAVLYHGGQEIAYARSIQELGKGPATIGVVFPGEAIHNSRASGTLTAVVRVSGGGFDWNDTTFEQPMVARHDTSAYSWDMFTPPRLQPGPKDPQPVEDLDYVLLRTGIMVVRIDRDSPDLTFYMTRDEGEGALFRVLYTRLLAFKDASGDGAPQAAEIVFTSALGSYDWEMSEIVLEEDPETGRLATFEMSTVVDLVENDPASAEMARPLSTVEEFARVTLTFTLASRDVNRTDDVGTYLVLGGAELKVDITIDVLAPVVGIDFLTVEQVLKDDRDAYRPRPYASDPNGAPVDEVNRYQDSEELKQRVEFRERASTPAFYSWVKRAEVTRADGTEEVTDVLAAYMVTDGRMLLYLSYPYDVEVVSIFHDPSLGIYEGGFPGIPEEWRALFDPLLYGVAALAAVAVVSALRSRGGREDEEDGDDDVIDAEETPTPSHPSQPGGPPEHRDRIPDLPDGRVETNGSTLLLNPPLSPPHTNPEDGAWFEVQE